MAKEIPEWDKANLEYHYEKHPASKKHKAHWNDLMGRDPALGPISIFKYELICFKFYNVVLLFFSIISSILMVNCFFDFC